MNTRYQRAGILFFLLVVSAAFLFHYLVAGTSIFLLNSVGSSSILSLKIDYDRFRHLAFWPATWTRLYGAGGPVAIGFSSFNPMMLLVSWIKPFADALIAYEAAMRGAGAFGCYLFLRRNQLGVGAALLGAGLFAFNGFSSFAGQDPQIGLSILSLPWSLLALQTTLDRPSVGAAFGLSAALAFFYFTASTQVFGFTILVLILPYVAAIFTGRLLAADGSIDFIARLRRPVVYLALAAVACSALTAFDLVEQLQNMSVSGSSFDISVATRDYLSVVPLDVLIVAILFRMACAYAIWWRAPAAAGMLVGYLSLYHFADLPISTILSASLGGVSTTSFVFDLQQPRYLYSLMGSVLGLRCLWVIVRSGLRQRSLLALACVGAGFGLAPWLAAPSVYYVRFVFVPLLGYCSLAALGGDEIIERLRLARPRAFSGVAAAIVCLTVVEAVNMSLRQTMFMDALKYTRASTPEMKFLATLTPTDRVIDEYESEHTQWLHDLPLWRQALPRWLIPAYAGAQTFSRVGLSFVADDFQAYYDRALQAYFGVRPGQWPALLNVAAVTHVISRRAPGQGFIVEMHGPDYTISRNTNALPRVQVYHAAVVATDGAGLDALQAADARGGSFRAVVAPEDARLLTQLDPRGAGGAELTVARDGYVEITANVTGRSLIVLADTDYPGWRAAVDGIATPILRANVAFRGVIIEPGEHKIEFFFEPEYHRLLLAIALIALAAHFTAAIASFGGGRSAVRWPDRLRRRVGRQDSDRSPPPGVVGGRGEGRGEDAGQLGVGSLGGSRPMAQPDTELRTTREFWDANPCGIHGEYEEQKRQRYAMEPWLPACLHRIVQRHNEILEVGCGQGIDSTLLCAAMPPTGRYVGIDYSEKSVEIARHNAATLSASLAVKPTYRVGNAEAVDFRDDEFAAVYSMGVLHHTANERRAIAEIRRVLKPGGVCHVFLYRKPAPKVGVAKFLRAIQAGLDAVLGTDRCIYGWLRSYGSHSRYFGTMFLECFGVPYMKWYSKSEIDRLFADFSAVSAAPFGANLGRMGARSLGANPLGYFWYVQATK
jgi:SAM-dependent methyltransferase